MPCESETVIPGLSRRAAPKTIVFPIAAFNHCGKSESIRWTPFQQEWYGPGASSRRRGSRFASLGIELQQTGIGVDDLRHRGSASIRPSDRIGICRELQIRAIRFRPPVRYLRSETCG